MLEWLPTDDTVGRGYTHGFLRGEIIPTFTIARCVKGYHLYYKDGRKMSNGKFGISVLTLKKAKQIAEQEISTAIQVIQRFQG